MTERAQNAMMQKRSDRHLTRFWRHQSEFCRRRVEVGWINVKLFCRPERKTRHHLHSPKSFFGAELHELAEQKGDLPP
jgi:hypothetical protein